MQQTLRNEAQMSDLACYRRLRSIVVKACACKARLPSNTLIASWPQLKHPKLNLQKDEYPHG